RPGGLVGSKRACALASVLTHDPRRSGYFDSSYARAPAVAATSTAANATTNTAAPITRRSSIIILPYRRAPSLRRPLEVSQVRRRLILLDRHQETVGAHHVVLLADEDLLVALMACVLGPERVLARPVFPRHPPGPGERVIDHRDVGAQHVGIGLVEIDALLDDGLVVLVQRNAGRAVEGARTAEAAGLDQERVEAAVAVGVLPPADRIAHE